MNSKENGDVAAENRHNQTAEESPEPFPKSPDPTAQRVITLKEQASTLIAENRPGDSATIVSELLALDDQYLMTADPAITRDILDIAGTLLPTGLFDPLEQLFLKGIQVLWNHSQATVADLFVGPNNLAALYDAKGNYLARDQVNSQIVAMADQLVAPLDWRTAEIFLSLAKIYDQAGHPKAAAILYRHLYRYVMSDPNICQTDTRVALIGKYGSALAADGQLDAALELYEQSLDDENERLQILLLTARSAQQRGDLDSAQTFLEHARDVGERSNSRDSSIAGFVYHNLASLYLQRAKHELFDEAQRLLELARDIIAKSGREESSEYAGELSQLATVAEAKGELDRAETLYREAFRVYESASDKNPQDYAAFLTDAGFLYLRLSKPVEAVGVFQRAKTLRDSMQEQNPLVLANTASNLATANFQCGNFEEAIRWYREAIDLRHRSPEFVAN